ncbi:MAG: hypothetical protein HIU57_04320 [Acidobacteria bacterium]|nr:hypothetical protein [Acidobacteriota bacterium]
MFHRFSTWWRALSVVLLGLATLTWPSAALAQTTPEFSVVAQSSVAILSAAGSASWSLTLAVPQGTVNSVTLALYPQIVYRSEVSAIIAGTGTAAPPVATTSVSTPTCRTGTTLGLTVSLFSALATGPSHRCGTAPLHLRLPCQAAACDGVYPLSIAVTVNGVRRVEWSMIAVHRAGVLHPLRVDYVAVVDPTAWSSAANARANFNVIAQYGAMPLTLAVDYRPLGRALLSTASRPWRNALSAALSNPAHRAIAAPPSSADYAGLAANGFGAEVAQQVALAGKFLKSATGHTVDSQVFVTNPIMAGELGALAHVGVTQLVLPDTAFSVVPSTTLGWGAPFHPDALSGLTALATDSGLEQLAANTSIEPGRRAALTLATLAFLHYEAPNAPAARTVVVPMNVGSLSPVYLNDLLGASQSNPFLTATTLTSSYAPNLIATDNSPVDRFLASSAPSVWSSTNVATLQSLISRTASFVQGIASPTQLVTMELYQALPEQIGSPALRQTGLNAATAYLNAQLNSFRIDDSSITLTGSGTTLPLTILSKVRYPVTLLLHLITDRLQFPTIQNQEVAVTLAAPTNPLRIATVNRQGGSLTLQLELTTPDGKLVVARAAVQVRVAGTSVVGYVLSGASLLVLAWWWLSTYRRKSRGRHAR